MPFKLLGTTCPEYEALRRKAGSLATVWRLGHVILTLAVPQAIAWPLGVIIVAWLNPESRTHTWTIGGLYCLVIAAEAATGCWLRVVG